MYIRLREIAEDYTARIKEYIAPQPLAALMPSKAEAAIGPDEAAIVGLITDAHLRAFGSRDDIEIFGDQILVMSFAEPERTAGGIIKPDKALDEARFQGKAGLVIAIGPQAFEDDAALRFGGQRVSINDWVLTRPSDGLEIAKVCDDKRSAVSCRLFRDVNIRARLSDPRLVW